ncbi:flavodoxin [Vibrio ouci]|uniref:Flavodoxin n=1 Tax=Vibrio ouci TaxID=2499078 RepID=A0A4Y8WJS7_9VIBR|nr:flavodoxin [Vibrio ouci]TFH92531.1 flavodoxin [Vibrio ouci]
MTTLIPQIARVKNSWLYQQVDVQFPTKESLKGLELYKQAVSTREYEVLAELPAAETSFNSDDIFLVDFHRLTVMFALIQSSQWQNEFEREMIVEFLTQIIYSEPCSLYLGFQSGEPVAAAIVTQTEQSILISDIVVKSDEPSAHFVSALLGKLSDQIAADIELIVEK